MALITIFTAPKPFTNAHIAMIQRNAIQSWLCLGSNVEIILLGEEDGLAQVAEEYSLKYIPEVLRNSLGTPLVSSLFDLARQHSSSPLLAYVNADIILLPDFVQAARQVQAQVHRFLIVGQRWDLEVGQLLEFNPGWDVLLDQQAHRSGRLHPPMGSDYFIYPRECFISIPPFAIGRAGWDNWMIYEARQRGWAVVDASQAVTIIHQDHDYSHLPGGQPHYRLPETDENKRLAGGKRAIFSLHDANYRLVSDKVEPPIFSWKRTWRELEILPLVRLHSYLLAQLSFALFHPIKAYRELRTWWAKQPRR